jgi:hypothetical protein
MAGPPGDPARGGRIDATLDSNATNRTRRRIVLPIRAARRRSCAPSPPVAICGADSVHLAGSLGGENGRTEESRGQIDEEVEARSVDRAGRAHAHRRYHQGHVENDEAEETASGEERGSQEGREEDRYEKGSSEYVERKEELRRQVVEEDGGEVDAAGKGRREEPASQVAGHAVIQGGVEARQVEGRAYARAQEGASARRRRAPEGRDGKDRARQPRQACARHRQGRLRQGGSHGERSPQAGRGSAQANAA